jgi:hypothetical protein
MTARSPLGQWAAVRASGLQSNASGGTSGLWSRRPAGIVGVRPLAYGSRLRLRKTPAESLDGRREKGKENQAVAILAVDVLPFIASGCDVPEGTFEFKSQRS